MLKNKRYNQQITDASYTTGYEDAQSGFYVRIENFYDHPEGFEDEWDISAYMMGYRDGQGDRADAFEINDELPVLGDCVHGYNLDREFCPHGCRV